MADTATIFSAGESFRGYTIVKLLGKGGLGEVYLAHGPNGGNCAIKVLYPQAAKDKPEYIKRFLREAKIAMSVRHPNLVSVHDVGHDGDKDVYYLVMDYVQGSDLRTAIAFGGAMDHNEAVRIIACVAGALAAGESFSVVHRDIKPENIMITGDGTVKLVDLGVAKARGTDSLRTMQKTVFGTPNYISPEQAIDSSAVDERADVYSLGVVLFELLTGRHPYARPRTKDTLDFLLSPEPLPDIREFAPSVPVQISALLQLMCAKDPAKRIGSVAKLLGTLAKFGYDVAKLEAERQSRAAAQAQDFDYAAFVSAPANNTLSFEAQDAEIREFVQRLKTRRLKKRILGAVLAVLVFSAAFVALAFLIVK